MSRERITLSENVLEESKRRIKLLYSLFDNICVSFSGGKDSLVLLELVYEVKEELGITKKPIVLFFDEEVIQKDIVDFVKSVMDSGRYEFYWICAQLNSERFLLGKKKHYIQWDVTREWVRPMPEWAVDMTNEEITDENNIYQKLIKPKFSNVVSCIGIRADESNTRARAIMNTSNLVEPFLIGDLARPIYDWTQKDIFKYIYEKELNYCKVYDRQVWGKAPYRVATPFNNAAAKHLDKVKEYDPQFYDSLLKVFPDTDLQARYYKEYDNKQVFSKYGVTPEGILAWVEDTLEGPDKIKCLKTLQKLFQHRAKDYYIIKTIQTDPNLEENKKLGKYTESDLWIAERNMPRFPLEWIFYRCIIGSYKKAIQLCTDNDLNDSIRKHEEAYQEYKKNNTDYKFE